MFAPLSRVPFGVFGSSQLLYFDKDSQTTCKRFQARRRWKPRCLTAVSNTTSGGGGKEPNPAFLTSLSPRKYWRLGTAVPEVIGGWCAGGGKGKTGGRDGTAPKWCRPPPAAGGEVWEKGAAGEGDAGKTAVPFFHLPALLSPRLSISPLFT